MANIENITKKIVEDAKAKKEEILSKANSDKEKTINNKVNEAKAEETLIIERAKREASTKKERMLSNAALTVRNNKLEAKQTIISNVFESALEELCKMNEEEYKNFIVNTIASLSINGDENIILNETGKKLVDETLLNEINSKLKGNLKVSDEVRNFRGGFIIEKNGVEINNTFEALVDSMKEDLEFEVARVLFG